MPMVGHQAIAQDPHRTLFKRIDNDTFECQVILIIKKELIFADTSVEDMKDHSARRDSCCSWHPKKLTNLAQIVNNWTCPRFLSGFSLEKNEVRLETKIDRNYKFEIHFGESQNELMTFVKLGNQTSSNWFKVLKSQRLGNAVFPTSAVGVYGDKGSFPKRAVFWAVESLEEVTSDVFESISSRQSFQVRRINHMAGTKIPAGVVVQLNDLPEIYDAAKNQRPCNFQVRHNLGNTWPMISRFAIKPVTIVLILLAVVAAYFVAYQIPIRSHSRRA
jgi:hypothetical protein